MKQSFLETAKQLNTDSASFIAGVAERREEIFALLVRARAEMGRLREKEEKERIACKEREREERLRQMLESSETAALHIGGTDEVEPVVAEQTERVCETPAEVVPQPEPPQQPQQDNAQDNAEVSVTPVAPPVDITGAVTPPGNKAREAIPEKSKDKQTGKAAERIYVAPKQEPRPARETRRDSTPVSTRPPRIDRPGQATDNLRPPRIDRPGQATDNPRPPRIDRPGQATDSPRPPRIDRPGQAIDNSRPRTVAPRSEDRRGTPTSSPYSSYDPNRATRTQTGAKPTMGGSLLPKPTERVVSFPTNTQARRPDNNKLQHDKDKKAAKSKKVLEREAGPSASAWDEDAATGSRKIKRNAKQQSLRHETPAIEHAVLNSEVISVRDFSEKIGKPAGEIIKKLFLLDIVANVNQDIDFDTCQLIATDFNITLEKQIAKTFEEVLADDADEVDDPKSLKPRPPVVTIMGHVDHGKTSLLDAIRSSNVTAGEAGGITQHIGAYTVVLRGSQITFVDTPGHEAFTSMRARGAQVTDVVVLVVAADDGIMPQTIEAINHAKAASVPIIVAINKIDKSGADPMRVKQQLTEYGLVSEEWGGSTICVEVSAKQRLNLDTLLEMILLQAEVLELKANPNRRAKGTILEAKLDKARGPVATVLVQNGTLKRGDTIVAGTAYGRIRAMVDDKGRGIVAAGPSTPVEILGLGEVPEAGDIMNAVDADRLSRQVAEERRDKIKVAQVRVAQKISLDALFDKMAQGELKDLNIIVKADVQGSVEAVKQALEKLSNDEVRVRCIHGGVGAITGSDIMFASASNAIVIGFNVRPDTTAKTAIEKEKVDVRLYNVIYAAIEDVEKAMKGLFKPVFQEVEMGRASVRNTFKVSGVGTIAGAYVQDGKVARNAQVRIIRDGIVLHTGKLASLKRFKDDAKEVLTGFECGIGIENFNDIREGDVIEVFTVEEVKR